MVLNSDVALSSACRCVRLRVCVNDSDDVVNEVCYFTAFTCWCISVCCSGEELNEVNIVQVSKWLLCVYKSMDEFACNDATLTQLKSLRMIPLTNGRVTSVADDTVFFPVSSPVEKRGLCLLLLWFVSWVMAVVHVLRDGVITVVVVVC